VLNSVPAHAVGVRIPGRTLHKANNFDLKVPDHNKLANPISTVIQELLDRFIELEKDAAQWEMAETCPCKRRKKFFGNWENPLITKIRFSKTKREFGVHSLFLLTEMDFSLTSKTNSGKLKGNESRKKPLVSKQNGSPAMLSNPLKPYLLNFSYIIVKAIFFAVVCFFA